MPKIIENIRERAIEEARGELLRSGYAALTIRGIAAKLGIGLGTFYNYFPSKEVLIANAILVDWLEHVDRASAAIGSCEDVTSGLAAIHGCLVDFVGLYRATFAASDYTLAGPTYAERHTMLCDQIAGLIDGPPSPRRSWRSPCSPRSRTTGRPTSS